MNFSKSALIMLMSGIALIFLLGFLSYPRPLPVDKGQVISLKSLFMYCREKEGKPSFDKKLIKSEFQARAFPLLEKCEIDLNYSSEFLWVAIVEGNVYAINKNHALMELNKIPPNWFADLKLSP